MMDFISLIKVVIPDCTAKKITATYECAIPILTALLQTYSELHIFTMYNLIGIDRCKTS